MGKPYDPPSLKYWKGIWMKNNGWKRKWLSTVRKKTWEKEVNLKLRNTRAWSCCVCKKRFDPKYTWCFAHGLSKKNYPKYRLNPDNIFLVCSIECHMRFDTMTVWKRLHMSEMLDEWKTNQEIMTYLHNI